MRVFTLLTFTALFLESGCGEQPLTVERVKQWKTKSFVYSAVFYPDGKSVLLLSTEGAVKWDIEKTLPIGGYPVKFKYHAEFDKDGDHVLFGTSSETEIWRVDGKEPFKKIDLGAIRLARQSDRMLLGGRNYGLYDLQGQKHGSFASQDFRYFNLVAISPDGAFAAMVENANNDGDVFVFDARSGALVQRVGLPSTITSINFSPNSDYYLVAAKGEVRMYGVKDPSPIRQIKFEGKEPNVEWSPDGRFFTTSNLSK